MARKVSTVATDDIDGSTGAEAVSFGLDGVSYEIDLSARGRAKLKRTFGTYIEVEPRESQPRRGASRQSDARVDQAAVRA